MNKAEVQLQIDLLNAQVAALAAQRAVQDDQLSKIPAQRAAQDAASASRLTELQAKLAAAPT